MAQWAKDVTLEKMSDFKQQILAFRRNSVFVPQVVNLDISALYDALKCKNCGITAKRYDLEGMIAVASRGRSARTGRPHQAERRAGGSVQGGAR